MPFISRHVSKEELGEGRFRNEINPRPVSYLDNGAYRPISREWVRDSENHVSHLAGIRALVRGSGESTIFPIRGNDDAFIRISVPHVRSGGGWLPIDIPQTVRDGSVISSRSGEIGMRVINGGNVIKHEYELLGGFRPSRGLIAFAVEMSGIEIKGQDVLLGGERVARFIPPSVYDRDIAIDDRPISVEFTQENGQLYMVYELPDLRGMSNPVVDPTFSEQPVEGDATDTWLDEGFPTTTRGTHGRLYGHLFSSGRRLRSLLKWDLSSIPGSASVDSATLSVWTSSTHDATYNDVDVFAVLAANDGWTESGATWNTIDGSTSWAGSSGCGTAGTDYNATEMGTFTGGAESADTEKQASLSPSQVEAMIENNYGMLFRGTDETTNEESYPLCYSSNGNAGSPSALLPKLVIEYTEASAGKMIGSPMVGGVMIRSI